MINARSLRILLFSSTVVTLLITGVSIADNPARPLQYLKIELSKSASPTTYSQVGEVITYTYTVTNNSGFDMYDVRIHDDLVEVICPSSQIEGGMTGSACDSDSRIKPGYMTCTATYVITQSDIDNGYVTNEATVNAKYDVPNLCSGSLKVHQESADANHSLPALKLPSINLTMTGSPSYFYGPGEVISYTYTVENTGNVSLTEPITVKDDLVSVSCPTGGLTPAESLECTASYTTTEADTVNGSIQNTAIAYAGEDISSGSDFEVLLEPMPGLFLENHANKSTYTEYWELIIDTYTVTNMGNVPIEGPFLVVNPLLDEWDCPKTEALQRGESITCTGYYRTRHPLGQTIMSCAKIEGQYLRNPVISNSACAEINYEPPTEYIEPGE
ncbi:MAG TPA: hypothetical protein G4O08_01085 [Anaerolineae bacterium]|nr:hypothetical protein [Anaerolineae bacterium]